MGRTATQLWCRECGEVTPCRSVSSTYLSVGAPGRYERTDHPDIRWFKRFRRCEECDTEFVTAEIDDRFLQELLELRDALSALKEGAAAFDADAKQSAKTLDKLRRSIKALSALE